MADLNAHDNTNILPDFGNHTGWIRYYDASNPSAPSSPIERLHLDGSRQTSNPSPINLLPAGAPLHPIIPDDLMTNDVNKDVSFLDFPPIEVPSEEEHAVRYFGVVKTLGPWEEQTAVVRTIDGCDVECSTRGCEGTHRLRPMELCQIVHYTSGTSEGKTFVTHAAAECTPLPSGAISRVPSQAGSRNGSRAPSRAQSPVQG